MASYLEIKQIITEILDIDDVINEECDIYRPASETRGEMGIVLKNAILKEAFDRIQNYSKDGTELFTSCYREKALQFMGVFPRPHSTTEPILDSVNNITYSLGPASIEYCMFLLDQIVDNARINGSKIYTGLRIGLRPRVFLNNNGQEPINTATSLAEIMRVYTLKIESNKSIPIEKLRKYASSFEFQVMYKRGVAVAEYMDIQNMYSVGNSGLRYVRENIDTPPQRIYNTEVLDYYCMAMEARDPFTIYISFYHVIEHYFDAVFRKKLIEEIKDKITSPEFSYKNEAKLYDLAKCIKKHMNSDDDFGKGNEFESLKYVLMEHAPIEDLIRRINILDPLAVERYQNNTVPFTSSKKTKISWSDPQGVYTNLATRIYETRNSLVHSKSEQASNQYRPYKNKKDLVLEIPLIKAVAELIIINSSEIL